MPGGSRNRQRSPPPLIEPLQCRRLVDGEAQAAFGDRLRQDLQRHLEDHPEGAETAGKQARHVVAGDILHHLTAEGENLAPPVEQADAEDEVAHGAHCLPPWSRQTTRQHAADRRLRAEMRRLARQPLSFRGQRRRQIGETGTGTRSDDEFGWLVSDDPPVLANGEGLAGLDTAVERLAAAAAYRKLATARTSLADSAKPAVDQRVHHDLADAAAVPTRACVYSRQRARVGTPLPGLSRPRSSKAALRR